MVRVPSINIYAGLLAQCRNHACTCGHGGPDAGEDEEEGEDELGDHGANAAGVGDLAVVAESEFRHG
jgi:hypothetical protein